MSVFSILLEEQSECKQTQTERDGAERLTSNTVKVILSRKDFANILINDQLVQLWETESTQQHDFKGSQNDVVVFLKIKFGLRFYCSSIRKEEFQSNFTLKIIYCQCARILESILWRNAENKTNETYLCRHRAQSDTIQWCVS